jgi:hypothetical protein
MKLTIKTIIRICLFTFSVLSLTMLHAEVSNKKDASTTESALFNDSDINKVVCKNLPQIHRKISDAVLPGRTDNGRSEAFSQSVLNRPGGDAEFLAADGITFRPSPLIEEHYGNNQVTYKPFWIINGHDFTYTFQIFFPGKADKKNDHKTNSIEFLSQQIETNTDLNVKTAHDLLLACEPPFYPSGGSIPPGDSAQVFVCFSSMGLPYGTYQAGLPIGGNAPGSPHYQPLELHVFPSLPCLWITPQALNELHDNPPQVSTQSIVLANNCSEKIDFIISVLAGDNSKNDGNNQWLSVDPVSGTILPGASLEIEVTFNSSGLVSPGEYNGELEIVSNDPFNPVYYIPVTLELEGCGLPPVESFYCDYIDYTKVYLSWEPPPISSQIIRWDDGINHTGFGLPEGGTFTAKARFTPDQLYSFDNWQLTHIDFFSTSTEATFILKAWVGETLMLSQPVPNFVANQWNSILLNKIVNIDKTKDLFIGYEVTYDDGDTPAGCDAGPAVPGYGDLIDDGTLTGLGYNYNWNLAAQLSAGGILTEYNVYHNDVLIETIPTSQLDYIVDNVMPGWNEFSIGAVYDVCISMSEICSPTPYFPAILSVNPSNFIISLVQGEILTEHLYVSNTGHPQSSLDYLITIEYPNETSETRGWLSVSPQSGVIQGNGTHTIYVMVNGQNLSLGQHEATIVVTANFPNIVVAEIPVILDITLSVNESIQSGFFVFPNPTSGLFTIEGSANHAKVTVFNAHGVEVHQGEQALPAVIDLTEQPRGVYLVKVEMENKYLFEKMIIH